MNRKQRILMGAIIFCALLAITFNADGTQTIWLWGNLPFVAVILVLLAFLFAKLWVDQEQKRQEEKMRQIVQNTEFLRSDQKLLDLLSEREKDVFKKIIEGKTNKQIANELNVALSTIKTHINNIYKILNVSSREELRKIANNS